VPLSEQLDEWSQLVADAPTAALVGLFPDVVVHLFDLLGAIGRESQRDHAVVVPALRFWTHQAAARLEHAERGPMQLVLDMGAGSHAIIGNADVDMVVGGAPFELLRAITGRRSLRQARLLRWEGADDRAIACFPAYGWRTEDLDE
jgi:hypothetical protein